MALGKTGRFLSKAEILGVGDLFPLSIERVLRTDLSGGMFRHSASPAILHRKSFAAIESVSRVHLGHTNRPFLLGVQKLTRSSLNGVLERDF